MSLRVAIFRTGGIGDVILSTVAIDEIRAACPDAHIHWFGRQPTLDWVAQAYPSLQLHLLPPDEGIPANWRRVKAVAGPFRLVLDLQHSPRTLSLGRLLAWRDGATFQTWGKMSLARSRMVWQARLRPRESTHELPALPTRVEAMRKATRKGLQSIGIQAADLPAKTPGWQDRQKGTGLAICLGALHSAKELPPDAVAQVAMQALSRMQASPVHVLGEERHIPQAMKLRAALPPDLDIRDHCGRTTLAQAAAILQTCELAIANDSALAHLSEWCGTPVWMFFGPTHPSFGYAPRLAESRVIQTSLGCRPCTKDGRSTCRHGDFACHQLPAWAIQQEEVRP